MENVEQNQFDNGYHIYREDMRRELQELRFKKAVLESFLDKYNKP